MKLDRSRLAALVLLAACGPDRDDDRPHDAPHGGSTGADAPGDDGVDPAPATRPSRPQHLGQRTVVDYDPGALIIPMDTSYQDEGMLRAFGLVYALLSEGVPVQWIIEPNKGLGDADFTADAVALVAGVPNGGSFTHGYRAGPFVVDPADAIDALPIVADFQTTYPEVAVHQAVSNFAGYVSRDLIAAPTIAMFADGNQKIARGYMQAAAIPDSTGNLLWPDSSPDMLDVDEVAGPTSNVPHDDGALFDENGTPVYCQLMSMHWGVNNAVANPEVVAEVREYLNNPVHFFAECQAVNAFENLAPHGFFLTPNGFLIGDGQGAVDYHNLDQPFVQIDGSWGPEGGSEPSYTLPPGDAYLAGEIVMITEQGTPEGINDIWMTGYLDGLCPPQAEDCNGIGKVSYLGGHAYDTQTPISTHPNTQGTRMFLNSLFEAPCAQSTGAANVFVQKSGPALTSDPQVTYTIDYFSVGQSSALDVVITDTIPPGSTYVSSCCGGVHAGGVVTWDLGNVAGSSQGSVTVDVSFPDFGSYDNVARVDYLAGVTPFGEDSNVVTTIYAMPTCSDGVQNQDESDIDCGGDSCPTCADGQGCVDGADCASSACVAGTCEPAACVDGIQNQDETDVDCGGAVCPPCGTGDACGSGGDCASGVCVGNVCAAPTCADGVQNQTESDVDCGGPTCPACADGADCVVADDCSSGVCTGGVCQVPTCADGAHNQDETDVDCGGATCPPCGTGGTCVGGGDCGSGVCSGGSCQAATCGDGVLNQGESDVDCGGPACPACPTGAGCGSGSDCASGSCLGMVCQAPTCADGIVNQDETDVDCGGVTCPVCGDGEGCLMDADCASAICIAGTCDAPACADGVLNGDETDVDCGGAVCPPCDDGDGCAVAADCTSGVCLAGLCEPAACDDGVHNGDETDVDCGGACPPCELGAACIDPADCVSGVCTNGACQLPTCDDGVHNGDETDVDCGGACPPCPVGSTGDGGSSDSGAGSTDGDGSGSTGGGETSGGGADDTGGIETSATTGGTGDGGGQSGTGILDGSTGSAAGTGDDGTTTAPAGDVTGDEGGAQDATDSGCGCTQGRRSSVPGWTIFALGLVVTRRRRRPRAGTVPQPYGAT